MEPALTRKVRNTARPGIANVTDACSKRIGENLRTWRTSQGLSYTELGDLTGFSWQNIRHHEAGKNRINAAQLVIYAHALRTTLDSLVAGTKEIVKRSALEYKSTRVPKPKKLSAADDIPDVQGTGGGGTTENQPDPVENAA